MKNFEKKYVETHGKDHKINYEDIKVIPLNSEKFITFQIGNLRFLDSYQFLSTSLKNWHRCCLRAAKKISPKPSNTWGTTTWFLRKAYTRMLT